MRPGSTIGWLAAFLAPALFPAPALAATAVPVADFGANPGALSMFEYDPPDMPPDAPLLVVMHGCTETAADIEKAGWEPIADAGKFYLVYPQQSSANNALTCFNWFDESGDLVRGQGENESIKEMVDYAKAHHSIDPSRVYVAGFSGGGAFVSVMLATWPDVFAGGAVLAGVPYRCGTNALAASNCMNMSLHPELERTPQQWGDLVRAANPAFSGPWPKVAIFHGASDYTVNVQNVQELVKQWTNVHGIDGTPAASDTVDGQPRLQYFQGSDPVVQTIVVSGMGHAVSVGATDSEHSCTVAAGTAYIEDHGLCTAWHAAKFFGLVAGTSGNPGGSGNGGGGGNGNGNGNGGGNGNGSGNSGSGASSSAWGCSFSTLPSASPSWLAASFGLLSVLIALRRRHGEL